MNPPGRNGWMHEYTRVFVMRNQRARSFKVPICRMHIKYKKGNGNLIAIKIPLVDTTLNR